MAALAKKEADTLMIALVFFLHLGILLSLGGITVFAAHGNHSHALPQVKDPTAWCIVKPSTSEVQLDNIKRYCCVEVGVDFSIIQPGGACYLGYSNKASDASVVMNIFYNVKGKAPSTAISIIMASLSPPIHWLTDRHKRALYEALEKVKADLMILDFISLSLVLSQYYIADSHVETRV